MPHNGHDKLEKRRVYYQKNREKLAAQRRQQRAKQSKTLTEAEKARVRALTAKRVSRYRQGHREELALKEAARRRRIERQRIEAFGGGRRDTEDICEEEATTATTCDWENNDSTASTHDREHPDSIASIGEHRNSESIFDEEDLDTCDWERRRTRVESTKIDGPSHSTDWSARVDWEPRPLDGPRYTDPTRRDDSEDDDWQQERPIPNITNDHSSCERPRQNRLDKFSMAYILN